MKYVCGNWSRRLLGSNKSFPTALVAHSDLEILRMALRAHLHQPAIGLWRATEFIMLRDLTFQGPVLDYGCGNGEVARSVLRSHWPIDGLELVGAEARVASASDTYRFVMQGSGVQAPVMSDVYGTVYSHSVFEHIPDDLAAIREVARVLRPGGRFVFTVPAPAFASRIMCEHGEKTLEMVNRRLGHYHYRSIDEWEECLDNVGLDVVMARGHLPAETQRTWLRLDTLMVRRFRGRRVLDWIRGLQRRRLIPDAPWLVLWSGLLWRSFKRPVDDPGGYLIVAQRRL